MSIGRLFRVIFSNPHYKFVSVLVAVLLWLYVQGQQSVDGSIRADIVWQLPPGLVATEPLPVKVTMSVTGSRAAVRRVERSTTSVRIDLSELETGAHLVDTSAYPVEGLQTLTLNSLSPSTVAFSLDELTSRKVVVDPVLVGTPREGYRVSSALPDPLVVTVRGAQSAVQDRIEVSTRPIDVSGLQNDAALLAALDLPTGVERVGDEVLEVFVTVEAESDSRRYSDVPVVVWPLSAASEWRADPEFVTVQLEGASSALRGVRGEDILVFAHLPESPDRPRYTVALGPAEGQRLRVLHGGGELVRVIDVSPQAVRIVRQ